MKRILIIDDEESIRALLRKILESYGYEVLDAANGKEGERLYEERSPDLVITDLLMPEQDGVETIVRLRARYPDAKIIAISGGGRIGSEDYLEMAETLGAIHSMAKPLDIKELHKLIRKELGEI